MALHGRDKGPLVDFWIVHLDLECKNGKSTNSSNRTNFEFFCKTFRFDEIFSMEIFHHRNSTQNTSVSRNFSSENLAKHFDLTICEFDEIFPMQKKFVKLGKLGTF